MKQCMEKAALRATMISIICNIESNLDPKIAAKRCMNDMLDEIVLRRNRNHRTKVKKEDEVFKFQGTIKNPYIFGV